ncbi:MAG: VCBS repeat-containing protein [Cyclobacteriaceae bacterium]
MNKIQPQLLRWLKPMKGFHNLSVILFLLIVFSCAKRSDTTEANGDTTAVAGAENKYTALEEAEVSYQWEHISSKDVKIAVPNEGNQQTATLVMDVDKNGVNDFIVSERTKAPSVVWYRRTDSGWDRYVIDKDALTIEAGSAFSDIDGDGDADIVLGGDAQSNQLWWWENPYPDFSPDKTWQRRLIKNSGAKKHHDQMFGDFDGDGKDELVFWNQLGTTLFLAEIPTNPKQAKTWKCEPIYTWSADSEMEQRGEYPAWRRTHEHEGLTKIDMDGDGKLDIVGGGRWFKHLQGLTYLPNIIDASYVFTRSAAGDLIKGGRPEVILVAGDGAAPFVMYEWQKGVWKSKVLIEGVRDGHSITIVDFDGDGNLDIFTAEMQLKNPEPKTRILLGDGNGKFKEMLVHTGFGLHESVLVDLNGDKLLDILGKPYTWQAPRLDIWINKGKR